MWNALLTTILYEYKNAQGEWAAFTAAEFKNKVVALAKGLIARGVMPGDSVSIIAPYLLAVDRA